MFDSYVMSERDCYLLDALTLAFVGDSVQTLFVRTCLAGKGYKVGKQSKIVSSFVNAKAQSALMQKVLPLLNETEEQIAKRGRNSSPKHMAKNSTVEEYKNATALESLLGFLYLSGKSERLEEILNIMWRNFNAD